MAPPVDFYILPDNSAQKAFHFACQLIEKHYQQQQQIYIHMGSQADAETFDRLLWTFKDDSFVPHEIYRQSEEASPIQIGYQESPSHHRDILINFHRDVPSFFQAFKRVIEIVFAEATVQQLARARFRFYRDQGCEMNTVKM